MSDRYEIIAWMLCHDLRFNEYVSVVVEAEKEPTAAELRTLLKPATVKVMEKYRGAGEPFELNSIRIAKL